MDATLRDIADFYRLALQTCNPTRQLVRISHVIAWVDTLIAATDVPDEWMFNVSLAKTPDVVISALSHVPPPATEYLSASLLVAYVNRLWSSSMLSREDACHLLWNLRDHLRPEHDIAAIVPVVTLEDSEACLTHNIQNPNPFTRVDEALIEFFGHYVEFDSLIPPVPVTSGD